MITKIKVEDAIGEVLLHDLTGVRDGKKCTIFKRGHLITKDDVDELLLNGKSHINVLKSNEENFIHEEDAAMKFGNKFVGENVSISNINEGKVNFISNCDGFVDIDRAFVESVNHFSRISFATKKTGDYVQKGEVIAAFRIVELFYDKAMFEKILNFNSLINVCEIQNKSIAIITIGSEIYNGLKQDLSLDKLNDKLGKYGLSVAKQYFCDDDVSMLEELIQNCILKYDTVLCVGGMSVDADDITAEVIEKVCEKCVYGTPIMPGSVFMVGEKNNKHILGLPANVLFSTYTAFDIFMPYVLMNKSITNDIVAKYGYGGLL